MQTPSIVNRGRAFGPRPYERRLRLWIALLWLAELADLITTHADRLHGGVEANRVAAVTLAVGGPGVFWTLKLSLVVAMAAVAALALHLNRVSPGRRARLALACVRRSLQVCVVLLTLTAASNVDVLVELRAAMA